jgi:hypothetical protein
MRERAMERYSTLLICGRVDELAEKKNTFNSAVFDVVCWFCFSNGKIQEKYL